MTAALARAALDDRVAEIAAGLAGAKVRRLTQLGGGRNSRVYRVETAVNFYALKLYPPAAEDGRDRLAVEATVLRWMQAQAFTMVPRLIAVDQPRGAALLSWEDGDQPGGTAADIQQACEFLRLLHERRDTPAVPPEHLAAEACLSGAEIARQLGARLAALRGLRDAALTEFLDRHAGPELAMRLARARTALAACGGSFDTDLPPAARSPVPADFGFHNALRRDRGRLTFIDFEYFGWDDPAKLIGDLLLHPGTPLDDEARARLHAGACGIYAGRGFTARLAALLPLLGLRWALILLNEFFPERWRRRAAAGMPGTWEDAKRRQLAAAQKMMTRHIIPGVTA